MFHHSASGHSLSHGQKIGVGVGIGAGLLGLGALALGVGVHEHEKHKREEEERLAAEQAAEQQRLAQVAADQRAAEEARIRQEHAQQEAAIEAEHEAERQRQAAEQRRIQEEQQRAQSEAEQQALAQRQQQLAQEQQRLQLSEQLHEQRKAHRRDRYETPPFQYTPQYQQGVGPYAVPGAVGGGHHHHHHGHGHSGGQFQPQQGYGLQQPQYGGVPFLEHHLPQNRGQSVNGRTYLDPAKRLRNHNHVAPVEQFTPQQGSAVDLRSGCPPVYDQGQLGSCTANAVAFCYEYDEIKQGGPRVVGTPSRLFIYYNERSTEGDVNQDAGAVIGDGVQGVHTTGVVPETMWPYVPAQFAQQPPATCYETAKQYVCNTFKQVQQTPDQIKGALEQGFALCFVADVFEQLESDDATRTGVVAMPSGKCLGGHAISIVGYDDAKDQYIVRNSWGADHGDQGYYYFPQAYIHDSKYCSQFWVLLNVSR